MKFDIGEELRDLFPNKGNKDDSQLLEMMSAVEEENTKLKKDNVKLARMNRQYRRIIKEKEQEISELKLNWDEAGDLAEYTMKINKVMEAAQKAAQDYVNTNRKMEEKARQEADMIIHEALRKKEDIIKNALNEASRIQYLNVTTIRKMQDEIKQLLSQNFIDQGGRTNE